MATGYILYNEKAGTGKIADAMQALKAQLKGELKLVDVLKLTDYAAFIKNLTAEDYVVVAGGDGTLNRFVNNIEGMEAPCDILYYPAGSGNDFARDLGQENASVPFSVRQWIRDLPKANITCWVLTLEHIDLNVLGIHNIEVSLLAANAQVSGSNLSQCAKTSLEVSLITLDHILEIRSEGLAIESRHEDCFGAAVWVSHHVIRTLTEERKHTALEQCFFHLFTTQRVNTLNTKVHCLLLGISCNDDVHHLTASTTIHCSHNT